MEEDEGGQEFVYHSLKLLGYPGSQYLVESSGMVKLEKVSSPRRFTLFLQTAKALPAFSHYQPLYFLNPEP